MITPNGLYIEELDYKQRSQLCSLCEEFQPYTKTENVVFLELVNAARMFCDRSHYPFRGGGNKRERFDNFLISELISKIKNKYYFNGINYI